MLLGNEYVLDVSDPFQAILSELAELHKAKSHDYAGKDDPYSNFYLSADQIQQGPMASVEVLIATKQARLRELMWTPDKEPANESVSDTMRDRAVYSVIALVLYKRGEKLSRGVEQKHSTEALDPVNYATIDRDLARIPGGKK